MTTLLRKGTDVVDETTGAPLGRVHAVYLDPGRRQVVGFAMRHGGIFWRRRPGLIDLAAVRRFGPDALGVAGRLTHGWPARRPEDAGLIALDDLTRRPVLLEDGTALGQIAAVRFCQDSRSLTGLDVEPEGLPLCRMLLGADQIVRLGPSAVVVREVAVGSARQPTTSPVRLEHRGHSPRRVA